MRKWPGTNEGFTDCVRPCWLEEAQPQCSKPEWEPWQAVDAVAWVPGDTTAYYRVNRRTIQLRESARKGSDNSGCLIRPCFLTRAPYSTVPVAQGTRLFWEYSYQTHSLAGQTSRRIYLVYDCCVCLSRQRLQLLVYLQIPPSISPFLHFPFPISNFPFLVLVVPSLVPDPNSACSLRRGCGYSGNR